MSYGGGAPSCLVVHQKNLRGTYRGPVRGPVRVAVPGGDHETCPFSLLRGDENRGVQDLRVDPGKKTRPLPRSPPPDAWCGGRCWGRDKQGRAWARTERSQTKDHSSSWHQPGHGEGREACPILFRRDEDHVAQAHELPPADACLRLPLPRLASHHRRARVPARVRVRVRGGGGCVRVRACRHQGDHGHA